MRPPGVGLGIFLRRLREEFGWSQDELARQSGISAVQIGRLERSQITRPHPRTWKRVGEVVRIEPSAIRTLCIHLESLEREAEGLMGRLVNTSPTSEAEDAYTVYRIFGAGS